MGTSLYTVGNHSIKTKRRKMENIAKEVCKKLNSLKFPNSEFLMLSMLNDARSPSSIRTVNTKREWTYQYEKPSRSKYYRFSIDFIGPYGLSIILNRYRVFINEPHFRYWQWFTDEPWENYDLEINEWRKYFHVIVNALGGNRVIYLSDNGTHLDQFIDNDGCFEETEHSLYKHFGLSKIKFSEVAEDINKSYMIDYLTDIRWNAHCPTDHLVLEKSDKVSIDINLSDYQRTEKIFWQFDYYSTDHFLLHKIIDGKYHFRQVLCYGGLLIKHFGVFCENETFELLLDEYAPFHFDELNEQLKNEGFEYGIGKTISLYFRSSNYENEWYETLDILNDLLYWDANGGSGLKICGERKVEYIYDLVDIESFIITLKLLREEYQIKSGLELYEYDKNFKRKLIFKFERLKEKYTAEVLSDKSQRIKERIKKLRLLYESEEFI